MEMAFFEVSLACVVLIGGIFAVSPILRKRYSMKWRCWAWLILAVRLLIPLRAGGAGARIEIPLPLPGLQTVSAAPESPGTASGSAGSSASRNHAETVSNAASGGAGVSGAESGAAQSESSAPHTASGSDASVPASPLSIGETRFPAVRGMGTWTVGEWIFSRG